jgi:hypothetical protein
MLYTPDGTGKVNWKEVAYYMLKQWRIQEKYLGGAEYLSTLD